MKNKKKKRKNENHWMRENEMQYKQMFGYLKW